MKNSRKKKIIISIHDELNTNFFIQKRLGVNYICSIKNDEMKFDLHEMLRKLGFKITFVENIQLTALKEKE